MFVVSVSVLLPLLVSAIVFSGSTTAVVESTMPTEGCPAGSCTDTMIVVVAPAFSVPPVQVTVIWPGGVPVEGQLKPPAGKIVTTEPAGSVGSDCTIFTPDA